VPEDPATRGGSGPEKFFRTGVFDQPMELPDDLADLQRFHGHLGVYVTVGLRMGAIGKRRFGHYKGLRAIVQSAPEPPMRCVLDGVQFSSGCTMGKGNIVLEPASEPAVSFEKDGRRLSIALRRGWRERIDREMSKEKEIEQSIFYFEIPEAELFELRED
jgi:formylmethanofuran dehydrogenase subunit E